MDDARRRAVIAQHTTLAAADSTGLDSSGRSEYFGRRSGLKKRDFPKISQVVDTDSHVTLAAVCERGPSGDDKAFASLARQAAGNHKFDALAADAGYDAEHHHRLLVHELHVGGIIPPRRGRPPTSRRRPPSGFFRRLMHECWPKRLYGQRWQVETRFSMEKRKLGPKLRARRLDAQDHEMHLRTITLNLMLQPPDG